MSNEYIDYLIDGLSSLGKISSRRMFGGYGLFHQGLMFALIANDEMYLKGDEESVSDYENMACERFSYTRQNKLCYLNYYRAPDSTLDDPFELQHWAKIAINSAMRAKLKKRPKKPAKT